MGWQWHQLDHVQIICTSLHADKHASTQFFTGRMPFLPPNQQRQSTEGNVSAIITITIITSTGTVSSIIIPHNTFLCIEEMLSVPSTLLTATDIIKENGIKCIAYASTK